MTFGEYTVEDEIGWSADSTVYEASLTAGGGTQPLAIKVRGYHVESEGQALLETAREQERAVAAGCAAIAPVLAAGLERHSFYCVLPRYPRSLLSLIEGKVTVRPEGLEELAAKVLISLRQLQERQGRSHGNLKASNVLLTGTAQLRDTDVFLTDLATQKTQNYAADVSAFGHIIYQLVRRREVEDFDWPLAPAAHWSSMGPKGEAVRDFCNALLDPALSRLPDPLHGAQLALTKLRGGKGSASRKLALIGVGVLALGAAAWFGKGLVSSREANPKNTAASQAQSEENAWMKRLAEELQRDKSGVPGDPHLEREILVPLRKLSPKEIDALQKSGGQAEATAQEVRDAFERWEARQVIARGYEELAALGWTLPAGSISRLRGELAASQPVLPQLRAISQAAQLLPKIQESWRTLQAPLEQATQTGDPILAKVPPYVAREAALSSDLNRLSAALEAQRTRVPKLLEAFKDADRERFPTESKFVAFTGTLSAQTLTEWTDEVRRFTRDPALAGRLREEWRRSFEDLAARFPPGTPQLQAVRLAQTQAEARLANALPADADRLSREVKEQIATLARSVPANVIPITPPKIEPPTSTLPPPMVAAGVAPVLPQVPPGDRDTFERLLTGLRAVDLTTKSGGAMRVLRDEFVSSVRNSTSPAFQKEVTPFLQAFSALTFKESTVAPALVGWQGPAPSPSGVVYSWSRYKLEFTTIPAEGDKPTFYLSSQEMSIGLLSDWMNEHGGNWAGLELRAAATVRGPRGWEPRGPSLVLRRDWAWPAILGAGQTFYPPKAVPPEPPSAASPLNYVGSRSAAVIAAQFSARLPTAEEWSRGLRLARSKGWDAAEANLRDARWEQQRSHVAGLVKAGAAAGAALRDPPWPDGDIFIPSDQRGLPRGAAARPARSEDDRALWFQPVNAGSALPLKNMVGNVAEFVADADGSRAYVVGGSALSPPELDPAIPYPLSAAQRTVSYADVGLRLALSPAGATGPGRDQEEEAFRRVLATAPAKKP